MCLFTILLERRVSPKFTLQCFVRKVLASLFKSVNLSKPLVVTFLFFFSEPLLLLNCFFNFLLLLIALLISETTSFLNLFKSSSLISPIELNLLKILLSKFSCNS